MTARPLMGNQLDLRIKPISRSSDSRRRPDSIGRDTRGVLVCARSLGLQGD